jgi:RNA polymerase sigma-70 factor, ECF subfamily
MTILAAFAEDLALAQGMAAGNDRALRDFYERHADPLFAFIAHRSAASREDVEDLWQDCLIAALDAIPTYRGDSALFTWLCGIARHKIADRARAPGTRREPSLERDGARRLANAIDTGPLPEDLLQQRDTRAAVVEALMTLPETYRRALVARYVDDQPVAQAAACLGLGYKATESLLSRAREALRRALDEDNPND